MRNKVNSLYNSGIFQSEIARLLGISRQRVSQIITGYKTIGCTKWKMELLSKQCKKCKNKAENVHHIDGNSRNNSLRNLMPLCLSHHYKIHTIRLAQAQFC